MSQKLVQNPPPITNDRMTANMMNVRLALRLIYHKYDKQSDFKTYLDCLPNDYATPLYWSCSLRKITKIILLHII